MEDCRLLEWSLMENRARIPPVAYLMSYIEGQMIESAWPSLSEAATQELCRDGVEIGSPKCANFLFPRLSTLPHFTLPTDRRISITPPDAGKLQ